MMEETIRNDSFGGSGRLTVGVVIPAYNASPFIAEALDSVACQSRPADHVVVVDDGSSDDTVEVVRQWMARTGFEVQILRQRNSGPSAARNHGMRVLSTDLVALLDADDVWEADHLNRLVADMETHPAVLLVFGDQRIWDGQQILRPSFLEDKEVLQVPHRVTADGLHILEAGVFISLTGGNYISQSTSVFRRESALAIGGFDPAIRHAEDRDFMMRLALEGPVAYRMETHSSYRVHSDNASHPDNRSKMQEGAVRVLSKTLRNADRLGLKVPEVEACRQQLRRQAAGLLYTTSRSGLLAYLQACLNLLRMGVPGPLANPKHLLRAIYSSGLRSGRWSPD